MLRFLKYRDGLLVHNEDFGDPSKSENQSLGKSLEIWIFDMFFLGSYTHYFENNYSRELQVLSWKEHLISSQ